MNLAVGSEGQRENRILEEKGEGETISTSGFF